MAVDIAVAVGTKYVSKKTPWFDRLMDRAPCASSILIAVLGLLMIHSGWSHGTSIVS